MKVLAYTVSYGDRRSLKATVDSLRSKSGMWFDWAVWLGAPSPKLAQQAQSLLDEPTGIQRLETWPDNRGQHYATASALALARAEGYEWLLRVDDDIIARTDRWLKKMIQRLTSLKKASGSDRYQVVAAPKITGLRNPLQPIGDVSKAEGFPCEAMDILGGGCRLHNVEFLGNFVPDLYAPMGRKDPEQIAKYVIEQEGLMVRFPDIRMAHPTDQLEKRDSEAQHHARRMGYIWCYLGAHDVSTEAVPAV